MSNLLSREFLEFFHKACISPDLRVLSYFCDKFVSAKPEYKKEVKHFAEKQAKLYYELEWKNLVHDNFVNFFYGKIRALEDSQIYVSFFLGANKKAAHENQFFTFLDRETDIFSILEKHHNLFIYTRFAKKYPHRINASYVEGMDVQGNYVVNAYKSMIELVKLIPHSIKGLELLEKIYHATDNLNIREQVFVTIEGFPQHMQSQIALRRKSMDEFIVEEEKILYHYKIAISHEMLKEHFGLSNDDIITRSYCVLKCLNDLVNQEYQGAKKASLTSSENLTYESEDSVLIHNIKTFFQPLKENTPAFLHAFSYSERQETEDYLNVFYFNHKLQQNLPQKNMTYHKGRKI